MRCVHTSPSALIRLHYPATFSTNTTADTSEKAADGRIMNEEPDDQETTFHRPMAHGPHERRWEKNKAHIVMLDTRCDDSSQPVSLLSLVRLVNCAACCLSLHARLCRVRVCICIATMGRCSCVQCSSASRAWCRAPVPLSRMCGRCARISRLPAASHSCDARDSRCRPPHCCSSHQSPYRCCHCHCQARPC